MTAAGRIAVVACGVLLLVSGDARAQDRGRITVGGGLEWMGSASYGSADATEVTPTGGSFTLFSTASRLTTGAGVGVKVGVRLTRLFEVEAEGAYLRPSIETKISGDFEGAQSLTAADRLRQFTVEAAALYRLGRWQSSPVRPFLSVSAGYLRQLHEGDALAATGRIYGFGGGVRLPFMTATTGRMKALGLRADARAVVRTKAAALDGRGHTSPAIGVSLFATF